MRSLVLFPVCGFMLWYSIWHGTCTAQGGADSLSLRRSVVYGGLAATAGASLLALDRLWYADYPRSSFHFFNDNDQWLQMDKLGHAFSAYQLGRLGHGLMRWSGTTERVSTLVGGSLGLLYLSAVEVLDGHSSQWGFSYGDALANAGGAALFIGQQAAWGEQRMLLKFSYSPGPYAALQPTLLGSSHLERVLKDYNAQTIWLSINPSSFSAKGWNGLKWLSLAVGHSAAGMLRGTAADQAAMAADVPGLVLPERQREWMLSIDADLRQIQTQSRALKVLFEVLSVIKLPAPAVMLRGDELRWYWLYF